MDKNEVIRKLKEYADKINSIYEPEMIYLFGSYAKGDWNDFSDIDVAIIFDRPNNKFEIMRNILKLRRKIDLRIEPIIFDLNHDPSGFLSTILDTGELIFKKN